MKLTTFHSKSSFFILITLIIGILSCFTVLTTLGTSMYGEEGMLPLSEIHKMDLAAKGLEIEPQLVYNPDGVSLIDGIINLSGCTASFVSAEGLILTNYHCAFRAIQSVTTKDNDYMRDGFLAGDRKAELPAKSYTVRITESYKDVSKQVLRVVKKKMNSEQRARAIEKKMKEIEIATEKKHPGKRAEVAEMFVGKTYVLFISTYIKDVRLVYAPPRSIGEFGGEDDNWMWPRHTGDFSFLRAYVAPDGTMAEYSPDNVPYHPVKHLEVEPKGVKENDFVFILGYPGRTRRHTTSHFVSYEEDVRLPYVVELYEKRIATMEEMSALDRGVAIKLAPRTKGYWNRKKRYAGQLKGLNNTGLVAKKQQEEKELQKYIDSNPQYKKKYGTLLEQFANFYNKKRESANYELTMEFFLDSYPLRSAFTVYEAAVEHGKKDTERKKAYMKRNFSRTKDRLGLQMSNYHEPYEKIALKEMMMRALSLPAKQRIAAVDALVKGKKGAAAEAVIDTFIENSFHTTSLKDPQTVLSLFARSRQELEKMDDPFMKFAVALYPDMATYDKEDIKQEGILSPLLAQLVEIKRKYQGKDFLPDANSTLRLTYGRVCGYSPRDAVYYTPFTTTAGIVEKHIAHRGQPPFVAPQQLIDLHEAKDFGLFKHPQLNDVPVAMLYNMDTVGGNSGSPVLNAQGRLIGLNFDRVFEATINDYAWDESYSRSIGVDIRFILWFTQKFAGADHLLKEMKVL